MPQYCVDWRTQLQHGLTLCPENEAQHLLKYAVLKYAVCTKRLPLIRMTKLFVTQRNNRINPCRAPGGNITRRQRNRSQHQSYRRIGSRIVRADLK
jgi:hypothetical protein